MSRNYVAVNKDLKKLQACEQISHPRTPEGPRRACWQAKKLPPHHSCVVQCGHYYRPYIVYNGTGKGRIDQFTLEG